ncbi:MAG: orotate phosphoribosyltransferase [Chloroflexi bacterium]|nr:orotate phosphoribosyltransferase [Chloroflexota bacterium]
MSTLAQGLFEIGAVKFGEFTLKSGEISPIYIDLRRVVAEPKLLKEIALAMSQQARTLTYDLLAPIPLAGLPLGLALSLMKDQALIYPRMEKKQHGTRQPIEGIYELGQTALLVDDVLSRATSKLEAIAVLEAEGLIVKDILVLIDREMGGAEALAERGYSLHAVYTLRQLLSDLRSSKLINVEQETIVLEWLEKVT